MCYVEKLGLTDKILCVNGAIDSYGHIEYKVCFGRAESHDESMCQYGKTRWRWWVDIQKWHWNWCKKLTKEEYFIVCDFLIKKKLATENIYEMGEFN